MRGRLVVAFTLIELRVVIAIVATLAAMLSPALVKAKQRHYMINCNSIEFQLAKLFIDPACKSWASFSGGSESQSVWQKLFIYVLRNAGVTDGASESDVFGPGQVPVPWAGFGYGSTAWSFSVATHKVFAITGARCRSNVWALSGEDNQAFGPAGAPWGMTPPRPPANFVS